jgi:hypothetical protein
MKSGTVRLARHEERVAETRNAYKISVLESEEKGTFKKLWNRNVYIRLIWLKCTLGGLV